MSTERSKEMSVWVLTSFSQEEKRSVRQPATQAMSAGRSLVRSLEQRLSGGGNFMGAKEAAGAAAEGYGAICRDRSVMRK